MRRHVLRVLLGVMALATLASVTFMLVKSSRSRLAELSSLSELRDRFNADRGAPRLVLLLSPT